MKTFESYRNNECTHEEYFGQFVNDHIKNMVKTHIGIERILKSSDKHMNDIPLKEWDDLSYILRVDFKSVGGYNSLACRVCVLKEAARQLKREYANK